MRGFLGIRILRIIFDRHEARERVSCQASVVAEIPPGDELPIGMRSEPLATAPEQLLDLVDTYPVVLVVVEDWQQDEQVLEDVADAQVSGQRHVEVSAVTPLGKCRIEGNRCGVDVVTERLEYPTQDEFATATRRDRNANDERQSSVCQLRTLLAPTGHRRPEHLGDRHRQERRRDIWTIVDVLRQREALALRPTSPIAHQPDWVNVDHERGGAAFLARFRVTDPRDPKSQLSLVNSRRVLVQQEAEIGCGLVCRRYRQQHASDLIRGQTPTRADTRPRANG
jgi:hypothetical protein